jgi:glycosyltransferase involved in cell wall biosynthesis
MGSKKIIINTVALDELEHYGGVGSYYKTVRPFLTDKVDLFYIGSRDEKWLFQVIVRMIRDYILFCRRLRNRDYRLVVLNPSLGRKAIWRDAVFLLMAKLNSKRVIVFIRGWSDGYSRGLRNIWRRVFCAVYGRADAMIVLANEFRERLEEIGIGAPIFLETTIVENSYLEGPLSARRENPGDPFNILFLGRIEKAKGVYITLESYRIIKQSWPLVTLTIAGDGSEFEGVRRYAAENDIADVRFLGFVRGDCKRRSYSEGDCYLFPTCHGEGMPNSVLEAMAMGLPVITRPVGGLRDFFEDTKMGFITESLDPKVYVQFLNRLISDPELCQRIGRYNREYARRRFAAPEVVKRLNGIFKTYIQ